MRVLAAVALALALAAPALAQADDTTPPQIQSVAFDRSTYGPGDTVHATLAIEDESDIQSTFLSLRESTSSLYLTDGTCLPATGQHPALAACSIALPAHAPGGRYDVLQVIATDAIGHTTSLLDAQAAPFGSIQVDSPYTDKQPPVISDFALDATEVHDGGTVNASFRASDESGLAAGAVGFTGPTTATYLSADCTVAAADRIACVVQVPAGQPAGTYTLSFLMARDTIGYAAWLESRHGQTQGFAGTLHVTSDVADANEPVLHGIVMPALPVPRGTHYAVRLAADDASALQTAAVRVQTVHGNAYLDTDACTPEAGGFACEGRVPARYPQGLVRLQFVYMADEHHNGGSWFAPWTLGCPTCHWLADAPPMEMRFLIGPAPLPVLGPDPVVTAVDPFFADVAPGHVLPVVVQAVADVSDLTFVFRAVNGTADDALSVAGCAPDANRTVVGSLCHLIVPDGAQLGDYVLDRVEARHDGRVEPVAFDPAGAPGFTVRTDSESPTFALPASWRDQVVGGVTKASFNAAAGGFAMPRLVDAAQGPVSTPPQESVENGTAVVPVDDGTASPTAAQPPPLVPAPRASPALGLASVPALAALALLARRRRPPVA